MSPEWYRFWKQTKVSFVPVALRAAPTLKNYVFLYLLIFLSSQNCLICVVLSIGSMLVFLVLKNAVECTSQRLKWTSGARVMIFPILDIFCVFRCLFFPTFPYLFLSCSQFFSTFPYFSILFHTFPYFSLLFPSCV